MKDSLEQALDRLNALASKAESEGRGMDISEIVEAVVGPDADEEILALVSIAMESTDEGMELEEMAVGVMSLQEWRNRNT